MDNWKVDLMALKLVVRLVEKKEKSTVE